MSGRILLVSTLMVTYMLSLVVLLVYQNLLYCIEDQQNKIKNLRKMKSEKLKKVLEKVKNTNSDRRFHYQGGRLLYAG